MVPFLPNFPSHDGRRDIPKLVVYTLNQSHGPTFKNLDKDFGKGVDQPSMRLSHFQQFWEKGQLNRMCSASSEFFLHNTHLEGPYILSLNDLSIVRILFWIARHKKKPSFGRHDVSQQSFNGISTFSNS